MNFSTFPSSYTSCSQQIISHFSGIIRKLACAKTKQSTEKASENNERTLFSRLSAGGVNFIFYTLSSLNFTSSLFWTTSFFSSFHWERYWFCRRDWNFMSFLPVGTLPLTLPILYPIRQDGALSFVVSSLEVDVDVAVFVYDRCHSAGGGTPS